jgi:beta-lactamase regulating signal transducer with metallopeptidase domain
MSIPWTSTAGWLLHCALGGGLVLLLTRVLMARTRQPALQQRLGEWGLAAALVVAACSLGPAWLVVRWTLPDEPATAAAPTLPRPAEPEPVPEAADAPAPDPAVIFWPSEATGPDGALPAEELPTEPAAPAISPPPAPPPDVPAAPAPEMTAVLAFAVGVAYLLIAGLLLARWLLGHLAVARLLRGATPAPAEVAGLFAALAGPRPPRLLVSRRLRVPCSCGLWRPTILLPLGLCEDSGNHRLRWVFAHELTHLRRRDGWSSVLFGLGQVVYFYLPWFWQIKRQVRLCQEFVADAVAGGGTDVADYAEFLLSLSAAPAVPQPASGVAGRSSDLFRRVTMLLQNPLRVEACCPRRWLLAAAGGLLALAVFVAGIGVRAEAPPIVVVTEAPRPDDTAPGARVLVESEPGQAKKGVLILRQEHRPAVTIVVPQTDAAPGQRVPVEGRADPFRAPAGKRVEVAPPPYGQPQFAQPQYRYWQQPGVAVQLSDKTLDALREAVKKLSGSPDKAEVEAVRKEIEKILAKTLGPGRANPFGYGSAYQPLTTGQPQAPLYSPYYPGVGGHGRLGIQIETPGAALAAQLDLPKGQGLVITHVQKDSPAAKAGIKVNDILLELNGKAVSSKGEVLLKTLQDMKGGTELDAVVLRRGRRETVKGLKLAADRPAGGTGHGQPPSFEVPGRAYWEVPARGAAAFGGWAGAGGGVLTSTFRAGDRFTSRYQEGNLIITVTGTVSDGKPQIREIHVQDGAVANSYKTVGDVPERYRDKVKHLLKSGTEGNLRIQQK